MTTEDSATTTRLNAQLAAAAGRMADIDCYQFALALAQPGVAVARGTFYPGGPVCLAVISADGRNLHAIQETVWNTRPAYVAPHAPAFEVQQ